LGKGLAGKSATQRTTKVAAGGFSVAVGCHWTSQLNEIDQTHVQTGIRIVTERIQKALHRFKILCAVARITGEPRCGCETGRRPYFEITP
jgi:hypothetical protein